MSPLAPAELFVTLARDEKEPLRRQLAERIREAIQEGRLAPQSILPSTRALAEQLGVSRGVVADAYDQLAAGGYLTIRRGVPARVRDTLDSGVDAPIPLPTETPRYDLVATAPDLALFPRGDWLRAMRVVMNDTPNRSLDYGDPFGAQEPRRRVAEYLGRVRGVVAPWTLLATVSGVTQGLYLACRVARSHGARRVAVENPSNDDQWDTIRRAGLEVVPVAVDGDGLKVDRLGDVDAVVVTPAHQFPTGAVLSFERRHALLDWARHGEHLVIEDDYDAEYRYDREPVGTLQGLAPDHVFYLGTTSKTLAPGLRLGWMVGPRRFAAELAAERWCIDSGASVFDQHAFAHLLESGALDRHLRRSRRVYRSRRDALTAALGVQIPIGRVEGVAAGLHLSLRLPTDVDEQAVVAAAAERGLAVRSLASYRLNRGGGPPGLVLGYGNLPEAAIEPAVSLLAESVVVGRGVQ